MALNELKSLLTPFYSRQDALLTVNETCEILGCFGFSSEKTNYRYLYGCLLKYFQTKGVKTPTQAWLLYQNESDPLNRNEDVFEIIYSKGIFKNYITLLMACSKIPMDRDFISENFLYGDKTRGIRILVLKEYYRMTKPNGFPNFDDLDHRNNRRLVFALNAFHQPNGLTENAVIAEFINTFTGDEYRNTNSVKKGALTNTSIKKTILEFIDKIYPVLIKTGAIEVKENIFDFLHSAIRPTPASVESLRNYLKTHTESLEETEFQTVIEKFTESYIKIIMGEEKVASNLRSLQARIRFWCELSLIALDDGVEKVSEITSYHRDLLLEQKTDVDGKTVLKHIGNVLKFYNESILDKNSSHYYNTDIFNSSWAEKTGKNANHTPLLETAMGHLISALAHKVERTKIKELEMLDKKELSELDKEELDKAFHKQRIFAFFTCRLLWFILLFGRRMTEIRNLKLASVKQSIKREDAYVFIRTVKSSDDKGEKFERGKLLKGGIYEFDYLHIDILNEVIKAAEYIYKDSKIPYKDQYLFPSVTTLKSINKQTISNSLSDIQKEFDILHGSTVDFKNKLMYESSPEWKKLVGKPLFTPHSLRHANIATLHSHAHLPLAMIIQKIGWRSHETLGTYTRTMRTIFDIFKTLEDNGHIGAQNELVSIFYKEVPQGTGADDNTLEIILKDFIEFLDKYKIDIPLKSISPDANEFTEVESDCVTTISCGDTGMSCLGCNDFKAGKMTVEALLSVAAIFDTEFRSIDALIEHINKRKKVILKKRRKDDPHFKLIEKDFAVLMERFEKFDNAKRVTLMSMETGWGLSEKAADETLLKIGKRARKKDLDPDIVKYIKDSREEGMFSDIDFTVYRPAGTKRVVFK